MDDQMILIHIQEELKDAQEYLNMNHETGIGIFHDLAHEEYSHAKILKDLYLDHGHNTDAFKEEWHQVEEELLHK